jgi:hypothetical protein
MFFFRKGTELMFYSSKKQDEVIPRVTKQLEYPLKEEQAIIILS